jgi:hypothetical protein
MEPLPASVGARLNPEVIVAALAWWRAQSREIGSHSGDSTEMEDDMADEQYGRPVAGHCRLREGRPDASAV